MIISPAIVVFIVLLVTGTVREPCRRKPRTGSDTPESTP